MAITNDQRYSKQFSFAATVLISIALLLVVSTVAYGQSTKKCKRGSRLAKCQPSKPETKRPTAATKFVVNTNNQKLATGEWADAGIQLSVLQDKTEIVFNCANGEIAGAFGYSDSGEFDLSGSYTPVLADGVNKLAAGVTVQARYFGKISGNEMNLRITSADGRMVFAEHTLSKDTIARIRRCG